MCFVQMCKWRPLLPMETETIGENQTWQLLEQTPHYESSVVE